jgi:phospholipid N-methyltransferase
MDSFVFFRAFLNNWKEVGSPLQSSRRAAQKICGAVDFRTARRVIEIGAGLGNVTKEILKRLAPDAQLIVFEINRDLSRHLQRIDDPRLVIHNRSGFDMAAVLKGKVDYVISEIPIATLSPASLQIFYRGIKRVLHKSGSCIQIQLSLFSYRKVRRFFKHVKVFFAFANLPPLFIYHCRDWDFGNPMRA